LDETGIANAQYYIATTASQADDRARVLKYGRLFVVFDRLGDVQTSGLGEEGLFFDGTRHLSEFCLKLWNARPLLLSSTVATNNFVFTADATNLDVCRDGCVVIHRGVLHLVRSRFLWRDSCFEKLYFMNHGLEDLEIPVNITFAADFADIFEIRGMTRERRGRRRSLRSTEAPSPCPTRDWTGSFAILCCNVVSLPSAHPDLGSILQSPYDPKSMFPSSWKSLAIWGTQKGSSAITKHSLPHGSNSRGSLRSSPRFQVRIRVLAIGLRDRCPTWK